MCTETVQNCHIIIAQRFPYAIKVKVNDQAGGICDMSPYYNNFTVSSAFYAHVRVSIGGCLHPMSKSLFP